MVAYYTPPCPYDDGSTGYRCACENPGLDHVIRTSSRVVIDCAGGVEVESLKAIIKSQEKEINKLRIALMRKNRKF